MAEDYRQELVQLALSREQSEILMEAISAAAETASPSRADQLRTIARNTSEELQHATALSADVERAWQALETWFDNPSGYRAPGAEGHSPDEVRRMSAALAADSTSEAMTAFGIDYDPSLETEDEHRQLRTAMSELRSRYGPTASADGGPAQPARLAQASAPVGVDQALGSPAQPHRSMHEQQRDREHERSR